MQEKKLLYGAIIFSLILVSTGFFITQTTNFFSKAVGSITGTVVLRNIMPSSAYFINDSVSAISLPGTTCKVKLAGCGAAGNAGSPDVVAALFSFDSGSLTKQVANASIQEIFTGSTVAGVCTASYYDNIPSKTYLVLFSGCPNKTGAGPHTVTCPVGSQFWYLAAAYECT